MSHKHLSMNDRNKIEAFLKKISKGCLAFFVEMKSKFYVAFYYTYPYSAWQRGSSDNLLREYVQKKRDLTRI